MQIKIKNYFIITLLLGGLLSVTSSVSAIEYGGIGLLPANPDPNNARTQSIFVETIKPLESKQNEVLVVNNSPVSKTLLIYAVDSQKSSDGAFACAQFADTKQGVGNWIKLAESEITLESATNKKIPFTIQVPENIGVGEENGCIMVQEKNTNLSQSAGATLSFRTGLRVAVTIPGEQIRTITLEKFDIDTRALEPKLITKIEAKNSGNTSVDTDIILSQGDKQLAKNTYPILRGDTATYNIELDKPYWGGFVEYTAAISYDKKATTIGVDSGSPKEIIKKTIRVFVFPQPQAIFVIASGFALLVIALFLFVRLILRARYRRLWTEEYIVGEDEDLESISEKLGLPWKMMARVNNIRAPYAVEVGQKIKVFPSHLTHPTSLVEPRIHITPQQPISPVSTPIETTSIPVPEQPQVFVTTNDAEASIESIALDLHFNHSHESPSAIMNEYTVKEGESIDAIAKHLGLDWKILAKINHIVAPYTLQTGQVLHISSDTMPEDGYTVQAGDTIETVADRLRVSWTSLAKANGVEAPYTLMIGQRLVKPKKSQSKGKTKSKVSSKKKTTKKSK